MWPSPLAARLGATEVAGSYHRYHYGMFQGGTVMPPHPPKGIGAGLQPLPSRSLRRLDGGPVGRPLTRGARFVEDIGGRLSADEPSPA